MASKKSTAKPAVLGRVVDVEFLAARDIYDRLSAGGTFNTEEVHVGQSKAPFSFKVPASIKLDQSVWTVKEEAQLAVELREALSSARKLNSGLLNDHGIWTWLGVEVLRDYVVNRWCGGYENGRPQNSSRCEYFLTGDGVHAQTRCAVRRLYIAAETSFRADGDDRWVEKFLQNADIYSSIFERRLGMDSELAVAMLDSYLSLGSGSRTVYRRASKLIGLILSTTTLEALDRRDKRALVQEAVSEVTLGLIDGK